MGRSPLEAARFPRAVRRSVERAAVPTVPAPTGSPTEFAVPVCSEQCVR